MIWPPRQFLDLTRTSSPCKKTANEDYHQWWWKNNKPTWDPQQFHKRKQPYLFFRTGAQAKAWSFIAKGLNSVPPDIAEILRQSMFESWRARVQTPPRAAGLPAAMCRSLMQCASGAVFDMHPEQFFSKASQNPNFQNPEESALWTLEPHQACRNPVSAMTVVIGSGSLRAMYSNRSLLMAWIPLSNVFWVWFPSHSNGIILCLNKRPQQMRSWERRLWKLTEEDNHNSFEKACIRQERVPYAIKFNRETGMDTVCV